MFGPAWPYVTGWRELPGWDEGISDNLSRRVGRAVYVALHLAARVVRLKRVLRSGHRSDIQSGKTA